MNALRTSSYVGLLVTIVLSACTASPSSSVTPGAPEGSGDALATSDPISAGDLSAEDEALVAEFKAEGVSEGAAVFLALTKISGEPAGKLSHRITESFPTGNSAEILVTLLPDRVGDPEAPPRLSYPEAGEDFAFSLEYFVSYDSMPADVVSGIRGATGHLSPDRIVLAGFAPLSGPVAAEGDGVQVVVEGLVNQFSSHTTSELLKILETRLGTAAELDNFFKSVQALLSVKDALAMWDQHDELQRQLDALEECARNPTNPITQRGYRDDPGYRDRILQQIASVRQEVKANTAVMFLGLLNETGSNLIYEAPAWLGYVVGPVTAWSKAALEEVNARLIADLKKNIVECDQAVCLAEATPPPAGPPPVSGPPPSLADPCPTDGTVSVRIEWDTNSPSPSSGYWQAGGSVRFERDPDASFDGIDTYFLTSGSIKVEGEFHGVNSHTGHSCTTTVPSQTFEYSNPLGPNHSSHPQGGGSISLDTLGVEGFPEFPPGNYYGQLLFTFTVNGSVTCNVDGTILTAPWDNEVQLVNALVIRSPLTHAGAPPFVIAEDGRMSGTDSWEEETLLSGAPGRITSSWNFVPIDD